MVKIEKVRFHILVSWCISANQLQQSSGRLPPGLTVQIVLDEALFTDKIFSRKLYLLD